ncbi:MAG: response regulator transcription factor [Firmicutes bacterium]|nr:response regulator transcription factor [Bacillota bacterium]
MASTGLHLALISWGTTLTALTTFGYLIAAPACLLIGILFRRRIRSDSSSLLLANALFQPLIGLSMHFLPSLFPQLTTGFPWLIYLHSALWSISTALVYITWIVLLSELQTIDVPYFLISTFVLAGLFTRFFNRIDLIFEIISSLLLPYISAGCMYTLFHAKQPQSDLASSAPPSRSIPTLIFLFLFLFGFFAAHIVASSPLSYNSLSLFYSLLPIITALVLSSYAKNHIRLLFSGILFLTGLGFFSLSNGRYFDTLSTNFFHAAIFLFYFYFYLLLINLSRHHAYPLSLCGFGFGIFNLAFGCGRLAPPTISFLLTDALPLDFLALFAGSTCCVIGFYFFVKREVSNKPPPDDPVVNPASEKDLTATLGNAYTLLTPRERSVLLLLLKGYSNTMIAEELFISTYTVKFHTQNIYIKYNVANRRELFIFLNKTTKEQE